MLLLLPFLRYNNVAAGNFVQIGPIFIDEVAEFLVRFRFETPLVSFYLYKTLYIALLLFHSWGFPITRLRMIIQVKRSRTAHEIWMGVALKGHGCAAEQRGNLRASEFFGGCGKLGSCDGQGGTYAKPQNYELPRLQPSPSDSS